MDNKKKDIKEVILEQREVLEEQGVEFHSHPDERRKFKGYSRSCCTRQYTFGFMMFIAVLVLIFYSLTKSDYHKVFSDGNLTIETDVSFNDGIDGDTNFDMKIYASHDEQVTIPAKTIMRIIFKSDKYQVVEKDVVFDQAITITSKIRAPYNFHIHKTDYVKSTKINIIIDKMNFDQTAKLR